MSVSLCTKRGREVKKERKGEGKDREREKKRKESFFSYKPFDSKSYNSTVSTVSDSKGLDGACDIELAVLTVLDGNMERLSRRFLCIHERKKMNERKKKKKKEKKKLEKKNRCVSFCIGL